ncbi:DUF3667 domain-containing protein [Glaciecola sp. XM2]|uniref:DUF3667 domain-containing protein n=1 Tax=Glaciecola sp. XM2 TaxID=1914931 RepID=UPI001BDE0780|nr:DUF3667 domain-containing protein [Glaciecola sp. XM2]MBT1450161.1 DUF3667 domain-containing protein [Glaciecola sp. XM2]
MSDAVFQLNRGLFFTIKEMTLHPAASITQYLAGMRTRYSQPITYAFTLATLFFLMTKLMGSTTFIDQLFEGYTNAANDEQSGVSDSMQALIEWFSSNYAYTTLLLTPVYALSSYIAFANAKRRFLEHVVLNLYITGHQSLIYGASIFLALTGIRQDIVELMTLLFSMTYAIIVFTTFFKKKHVILMLLQALLTYALSIVFISLFMGFKIFLITVV